MGRGEVVLASLLGLVGIGWFWLALDLRYMGDFAPGAGFLPVWLSVMLVALAAVFVFRKWRAGALSEIPEDAVDGSWKRPMMVTAALLVCVGVIDWRGFVISVTLFILFLVRIVENYRWITAVALALGTSLTLWALFKAWLHVPLPSGPLGF